MSEKLFTRDGKEVRPLGTWEQEQLDKMRDPLDCIPIAKHVSVGGKTKATIKDNRMIFISRPFKGNPQWKVRVKIKDEVIYKAFIDRDYGGKLKSLEAAMKFRDEIVEKYRRDKC